MNSALLSRCKLIVLEKLETSHIEKILKRACENIPAQIFRKDEEIEENDEYETSNLVYYFRVRLSITNTNNKHLC